MPRQAHTWAAEIAATKPGVAQPAVAELRTPAPQGPYYDLVYGPVAAFWNQRMSIADADQLSFHTAAA